MYNDAFFDGTGPMFVLIGGEYNMYQASNYLAEGLMFDLAKKFKAYMFLTEHRFYGESVPDGDLRTRNLLFLGVEQVLRDLKNFIITIKRDNPTLRNSKVVLFGVGYAGSIATWMRVKFPSQVDAVVASGAPLKAEVDFKQFFVGVQNSLTTSACAVSIFNAFTSVKGLIMTSSGRTKLINDFNFCEVPNLGKAQEQALFFKHLAAMISNVVKYGTKDSISVMCQALTKPCVVDDYTRLVEYINSVQTQCFPIYTTVVSDMKDTSLSPNKMARQWLYLSCSEFGWFETTSGGTMQPFSITIPKTFYTKMCKDVFGIATPTLRLVIETGYINMQFGSTSPKVTQTVFTQGALDPYQYIGVTSALSNGAPGFVIADVSHGADFRPSTPLDPSSVVKARQQIAAYLTQWLA